MKKTLFFIAVLFFTATIQLQAAHVIYYVSTTGNDNNNPCTQTTPWQTIQKALGECNDPLNNTYEIRVERGTYSIRNALVLTQKTKLTGGYDKTFTISSPGLYSYIEPIGGYLGSLMDATNPAIGSSSEVENFRFRRANCSNNNVNIS